MWCPACRRAAFDPLASATQAGQTPKRISKGWQSLNDNRFYVDYEDPSARGVFQNLPRVCLFRYPGRELASPLTIRFSLPKDMRDALLLPELLARDLPPSLCRLKWRSPPPMRILEGGSSHFACEVREKKREYDSQLLPRPPSKSCPNHVFHVQWSQTCPNRS